MKRSTRIITILSTAYAACALAYGFQLGPDWLKWGLVAAAVGFADVALDRGAFGSLLYGAMLVTAILGLAAVINPDARIMAPITAAILIALLPIHIRREARRP